MFSKLKVKVLHHIAATLFRLLGWRLTGQVSPHPKEVLIAAPHTSNWDYCVMIGASWYFDMPIAWIGKKELFQFWPLNWFFRLTGGIPIERSGGNRMVESIAEHINRVPSIRICVPPEGSRKKQEGWRSGFYYIAVAAQIPITCSFIDYATKTAGIGPSILPTGVITHDMAEISRFYQNISGKYPSKQSPIKIVPKKMRQTA